MILVSVIIPTRNRAELVGDAIESVLAVERRGFELEVIVVDDGSTDETPTMVARYPVIYLPGTHWGASAARNAGIKAAHGDFIAFLDDDDVWLPNNITPQLAMFAANPSFGAVHAQVTMTGPDRVPFAEPGGSATGEGGWIFRDLLSYWPQLASVVIRRAVLDDVGLFDTTLHSEEEWDLLLRIARRYSVGRVGDSVALFRQRCNNDEALSTYRMPDTIKVFRRHVRQEPLWERMLLQRVLWRHRGWYAAHFLGNVRAHVESGEWSRAYAGFMGAVSASPLHVLAGAPPLIPAVTRAITRTLWSAGSSVSSLSD